MAKLKDPSELFTELGIDEERSEKIQKALVNTEGFKKIENFIVDLSRKVDFLRVVKEIRKKFDIPEKGFDYPVDDDSYEEVCSKFDINDEFVKNIVSISSKYGIEAFADFIQNYILFNNVRVAYEYMCMPIIEVEDLYSTFFVTAEEDKFKLSIKDKIDLLTMSAKTHPVGILIHPYMSQRDVIDAIKKVYELQIEPLQKKYRREGVKLGKARKKSERVEERNKFIYENRLGKSRKELVRMVNEKFGEIMDYTYINRIIKEEREKNK